VIHSRQFLFDQFSPIAIYNNLRGFFKDEISFLFESASTSEGNYSFINIGAHEHLRYQNDTSYYTNTDGITRELDESPITFLKEYYSQIDMPSFKKQAKELNVGYVDGFVGMIGFDSVKVFEPKLMDAMKDLEDQLNIPDIDLIRPNFTLVFSHKDQRVTLLSPCDTVSSQFDEIESLLKGSYEYVPLKTYSESDEGNFAFDKEKFFKMIESSKEMIRSGDVFQILMANRYQQKCDIDPFSFYRVLRSKNPSPYMFLMQYEDYNIVGSSPEVMVGLQNNEILLRPIAGTRKRGDTHQRDHELEIEMLNDPKECAEHIMLVDLGRNDVGRVAKPGTIQVNDLMHVERYSHVMHMVTDVVATLDDSHDMFDLFAATFTAGTMTGAPKIRAMELIAEYEGIKRSFYSGSIAYFGFTGDMDSAITIRTALIKDQCITLQAGAGIVADSVPELEYLEVTNKLKALKTSLEDLRA
jgi:anthranilate synthase component I